jgi:hypothetical protein
MIEPQMRWNPEAALSDKDSPPAAGCQCKQVFLDPHTHSNTPQIQNAALLIPVTASLHDKLLLLLSLKLAMATAALV